MPQAVAVVSDLMFSSKIVGTAQALGIDAATARTAEALDAALSSGDVRFVMVDMSLSEEVALAALRSAADHPSEPTTLAFFSHVQTQLRDAAEQAGADLILPRSRFSTQLPDLLTRYCHASG